MRAVAVLLALAGAVPGGAAAAEVRARLEDGRLTVRAEAVPLSAVLDAVVRDTGMVIEGRDSLDPRVAARPTTVRFEGLRVEEVFRRMLPESDFLLVESPDGLEVTIYPRGTRPPPPPVRSPTALRRPPPRARDASDDPAVLRATALGDPDPARRAEALHRLSLFASGDVVRETVLEVLERERDRDVLDGALDLLRQQDAVPLDRLIAFAGREAEPDLRVRALELLGEKGREDRRVRGFLRTMIRDSNEQVRETAQRVLEELEAE